MGYFEASYQEFWASQSYFPLCLQGFLWLRRTKAAGFSRKRNMPKFGACCAHDHDCEAADCGPSWSLHEHIDMSNVSGLFSRADPAQCYPAHSAVLSFAACRGT